MWLIWESSQIWSIRFLILNLKARSCPAENFWFRLNSRVNFFDWCCFYAFLVCFLRCFLVLFIEYFWLFHLGIVLIVLDHPLKIHKIVLDIAVFLNATAAHRTWVLNFAGSEHFWLFLIIIFLVDWSKGTIKCWGCLVDLIVVIKLLTAVVTAVSSAVEPVEWTAILL